MSDIPFSISSQDPKTQKALQRLEALLAAIEKHKAPTDLIQFSNDQVETLKSMSDEKLLRRKAKSATTKIIATAVKDHRLTPRKYHQMTWMGLGMAVFGVPIGVALSSGIGNSGMIGAGIAIGLPIGMAIGTGMDKKAASEGRQLDFDYM